ncbi:Membrane-associated lipoprotein precurser [Croceitalea dokdonensis DOKDO 023]|uniref:Membrane-associated lipoprotein precurser n=1 Tax=Croceitalea dokdonensis DOKDO 023 TaxID=1300341 RepID=A0A0P7A2I6_9FLAO|nr:BspA family leucine-rich repeat surface protein [Croceitalea dokdonensis]KPM30702.1 Membrane-associated lipoprotein precurser [Croceitalea dokdonensis DOKDO 023]
MFNKVLLSIVIAIIGMGSAYAQPFVTVWNTENVEAGSSADNQITIPTNPAFTTYNYDVDWGDGTTDNGVNGNITHTYATPGIYTVSISGNFPAIYFNGTNASDRLKIIEILQWGDIEWRTMERAFLACVNLNFGLIDSPNLSQVTSLKSMFQRCNMLNAPLNLWNTSTVTDMSLMFMRTIRFNQPLNDWDVSAVTDMSEMFHGSANFNQDINDWDVSSLVNMFRMFSVTNAYNQPMNNWDVSAVTDMSFMFAGATIFNQPINAWNVSSVNNMSRMFGGAQAFDQPLNDWNVTSVTNMSGMFFDAISFNQPLINWDVSSVVDMSSMFRFAENFNGALNTWDVSSVSDMSFMFSDADSFDQPLNTWNVAAVTNMAEMFNGARNFNQVLNAWDVSSVTDMTFMFANTRNFNQQLNSWDVSSVTDISSMFSRAENFNQPLNDWDVSSVTNISSLFSRASNFNQPLNSWKVSSVINMSSAFSQATSFNQPLNNWDVSAVMDISGMFSRAENFDQPLNDWDVSSVTNISFLFFGANNFNQSLDSWNVSSVVNMSGAFSQATSFNQPLNNWDVTLVNDMTFMLSNTAITIENYDTTLIGWSAQNLSSNVELGAFGLSYCLSTVQRQSMVDNFGWVITGDTLACPQTLCTTLINPLDGDTDVVTNTTLSWEAAQFAAGYRITITTTSGTNEVTDLDLGDNTLYSPGEDFTIGDVVTVTIVPYNALGDAVGCTTESFTIEGTVPECTELTAPIDGAVDVVANTDIVWNRLDGADGYRITITTTSGTNEVIDLDLGDNIVYSPGEDFTIGDVVTVTIVPYNALGDAVGCPTESFTIEGAVPKCTELTGPIDGAVDVVANTDIVWNRIDGSDGYRITITTTSGTNDVTDLDLGDNIVYSPGEDFTIGDVVMVTIVPYNALGDAVGCPTESFTIEGAVPECTSLISPLNFAIDIPVNTNLSWDVSEGAQGYFLKVGTSSDGSDLFEGDVGNATFFGFNEDLPPNTEIFVFIQPYNSAGVAFSCEEEQFITELPLDQLSLCTTILTPEAGAIDIPVDTSISWSTVTDVSGYLLHLGTTEGGSEILSIDVGPNTSFNLQEDLPFGQEIFVMIVPYTNSSSSEACESQSFITVAENEQIESLFGFSPDNDGNNDVWIINGIEEYPDNTVMIFNRWGDKVFTISGYDNNSNVFRGEANRLLGMGAGQLPEGTYFFMINIPTEHRLKTTQGYLVLKR